MPENPHCTARRYADGQFRCHQCGVVFDAGEDAPCEAQPTPATATATVQQPFPAALDARFRAYDAMAAKIGLPPLTDAQKRRAATVPDTDGRRANGGRRRKRR